MAGASSTTPDLGGTAISTAAASPVTVMTTSTTSTTLATVFDSSFRCTAADFAPARRPHPRPWERVPVPAVSAYITLRKVWKRVGALPLSGDNARYLQIAAELRADGQGPRKMPRTQMHVPVWGDATWSEASTDDMPVPQPETDAPSTEITAPIQNSIQISIQSSPLSNVSRKRNSQRQPIAPRRRTASASPTADVATATLPESQATRAPTPTLPLETAELPEESTNHVAKRAKRRLSRRISILPQPDNMSPAKAPQTASTPAPAFAFASPVKRRVSFFILDSELPMAGAGADAGASPTKTISPSAPFEPVLASSPVKTLAAQSPNKLGAITEESDDTAATTSPVAAEAQPHVVVFTQPTAEAVAESPQQVRRRLSLHNTRRRETWLAAADAIDLSAVKPKSTSRSSRRHSYWPGQILPSSHKPLVFESTSDTAITASMASTKPSSRRHTFQPGTLGSILSTTSEGPHFSSEKSPVPGITVSNVSDASDASGSTTQDETVVVDARTNLDIFGSGPPVQVHSSAVDHRVSLDREAQIKHTESISTDTNRRSSEVCKAKETEAEEATPAGTAEMEVAKAISLGILEEDTAECFNNSTPREFSPDLDSSPELADDQSLVSRKRTSLTLDESLLLPLPDTTETDAMDTMDTNVGTDTEIEVEIDDDIDVETTESKTAKADDGWQSPTAAELDLLKDLLDTPLQPEPIDMSTSMSMSVSPVRPKQLGLNVELPAKFSHDDAMEGDEALGSVAEQMDAPLSSDGVSPSDDEDDDDDDDDELDLEHVDYTVTQPIHMLQDADQDADEEGTMTMTMTMDLDALVEEQLSAHEDSETEMLRNFVTRVKADKSAKAKAKAAADADSGAAAIRARNTLRPKRRSGSGSMGSTASASGSPMAKKENVFEKISSSSRSSSRSLFASPSKSLDANRPPLGKKDSNMSPSPSPRKKRKELSSGVNFLNDEKRSLGDGGHGGHDGHGDHVDLLSKPSFDDHSPPRQKRRRKRMEADTGSIFNPEFMSSSKDKDASRDDSTCSSSKDKDKDNEQAGPRRSKRTRSNQTPSKLSSSAAAAAAATSTNGVLSLIPVRLPGSLNLNGEDSYGLTSSGSTSLSLRRNDEKDLATMTRVNTRKNKAGSDPPGVVIQRLSQERAQEKWRAMVEKREQREQREREGELGDLTQKSVFDSPLAAAPTSGRDKADTSKAKAGGDGDKTAPKSRKSSKKHAASASKPSSKGKTVRWAEVLARFQAQDSESVEHVESVEPAEPAEPADVNAAVPVADDAVDEPAPAVPTPAAAAPEPERRSIPRRTTRVSRLPPPTPSKVIAAAAAKASLGATASTSATASASASETTPGLKAPRMATRRAKIVGMGMAANGTPAPKRRTTRTT